MNSPWDEVEQAIAQAKSINYAVDKQATQIAKLLNGRLRHVSVYVLRDLKKQLTGFDAAKRVWKDQK